MAARFQSLQVGQLRSPSREDAVKGTDAAKPCKDTLERAQSALNLRKKNQLFHSRWICPRMAYNVQGEQVMDIQGSPIDNHTSATSLLKLLAWMYSSMFAEECCSIAFWTFSVLDMLIVWLWKYVDVGRRYVHWIQKKRWVISALWSPHIIFPRNRCTSGLPILMSSWLETGSRVSWILVLSAWHRRFFSDVNTHGSLFRSVVRCFM